MYSAYEMGSEFATAMGESLALIPSIDTLNLASNRISDAAASDVIASMAASPTLRALDFAANDLGLQAAKALATLLGSTKSLTSINLAHNKLNSRAIVLLCDGTLARLLRWY